MALSCEASLPDTFDITGQIVSSRNITANRFLIAPPNGQTNVISGSVTVGYKAGSSIVLNPGFKTEAGAVFKAEIGGCN